MPIKPWWAVCVIAFYAALLGGSFWAGQQWKPWQAPDLIEADALGNVYVGVYNTIQQFNPQGQWQREYPLANIGIIDKHPLGGFAFFSNGDVLLLAHDPSRTLVENLQRFNRSENTERHQQDSDAAGLMRCNAELTHCVELDRFTRKFKNTFRLHIDQYDQIFVADTAGHKVFWLDPQGQLIDSLETGLKYPNDLKRIDNTLWIVNTNHHELLGIDISSGRFGKQKEFSIFAKETRKQKEIWPSEAEQIGKYWFVLNNENGMDKGGVYQYDTSGTLLKRLDIQKADPISIGKTAHELWVADFKHLEILRFNFEGDFLGLLKDQALEEKLSKVRERIFYYQWAETIFWYGFWVFLAVGIVVALILDARYRNQHPVAESALKQSIIDDGRLKPSPMSSHLQWQNMGLLKLRILITILFSFVLFGIVGLLATPLGRRLAEDPKFLISALFLMAVALIGVYLANRMMHVRLAVDGPWLLIKTTNKTVIAKGADIQYTSHTVMVEDVSVGYKDGHGRYLFDKKWTEDYLLPLLDLGKKLTQLEFMGWQLKKQPVVLFLTWSIVFLAIILVVYLKLIK